jgi:hypothetical protein
VYSRVYFVPPVPVRASPLKTATPELIGAVAPALTAPPLPVLRVAVTTPVLNEVTTLPPESRTVIAGCWARTAPEDVITLGSVVTTNFAAAPTLTVTALDTAVVRVESVKVKVYEPANAFSASPVKVATPATAVAEGLVSDTPPAVNVAVTIDVLVVTTLPCASSTLTTGTTAKVAPLATLVEGWVVTTNFDATPANMAIVAVTGVRALIVGALKVSVYDAATAPVSTRPLNVALPVAVVTYAYEPAVTVAPTLDAAVIKVREYPVLMLPPKSSTVTTGWAASTAPLVVVKLGAVVNANFAATPAAFTTKELEVTVNRPSLNVNV